MAPKWLDHWTTWAGHFLQNGCKTAAVVVVSDGQIPIAIRI